ncbi:DUF3806 domain-containing protein [Lapillicoccus jejuensis]|uniref:Uncharacterized protein DUF3806 n=1 Tax=Lapillicoccus jejuensis TaxID=402171 RepID=A0A542E649_9MICO|nr:DUF3806 domain-containing protein [Lapillicoccus jejuensis]TQJ10803.1 uncharacterized protein DUF3806 [Lapillicoccus jejuensis]
MAWFSRKDKRSGPAAAGVPDDGPANGPDGSDDAPEYDPEVPLRVRIRDVGDAERARVEAGLAALADLGVDVDDVTSLGAGLDRATQEWQATPARKRGDEDAAREPWVVGVGEHLVRHSDLEWALVRDAFGTDLAVAQQRDDFAVVPANLVGARWMAGETGWLPGVVAHLLRVRESRRPD